MLVELMVLVGPVQLVVLVQLVKLLIQVIYEKLVDLTGNPAVPLVLVGNKSDLHAERAVTEATGRKLAADMKVGMMEGISVMEVMELMEVLEFMEFM